MTEPAQPTTQAQPQTAARAQPQEQSQAGAQERAHVPLKLIHFIFFLSGMAALLYQLIWQRALFTFYGTNSESITAIVAAFMLGLGLGSLVGGEISRRAHLPFVAIFAVVEVLIGAFGLISLPLLDVVGQLTAGKSALVSGALSFALVVIPTGLMGSTLPLLVTALVRRDQSVGEAVGDLYYINTLGSAAVCILAALVLFEFLGMSGSIWLAAALNFTVAGVTFVSLKRHGW